MSSKFIYLQNLIQRVLFSLNYSKKFYVILTIFSSLLQQILSASTISMPELRLYNIQRQEYDSFAEQYLLPEDFELASKTPIKKPNAYELDAILNKELFEGDILGIDPVSGGLLNEERIFNSDLIKNGNDEEKALFGTPYYSALNTQTYADKLWADAKVPYVLEQGMSPTQRASIASAFDEYKGKTCIRFVPRQETDPDFIYIKRNNAFGCSSYVGRAGGNQTVSLEVDKCFSKGIIAHELMHALGFFHEHSRTDRDDFVEIQEENIRPGMLRNFEKYPRKIIDPLTMPYDYDSVMHYHKLAFSRNGRPTIVPKKGDAEIGQRYVLNNSLLLTKKLFYVDTN
uniref:Metalloendopeptidase n=2 Tax=Meloidogyne TaxID=189290 RepID=A0A6V7XMC2_MELEN|nr:unnamed protein product [Meloidogyne enterolobii]